MGVGVADQKVVQLLAGGLDSLREAVRGLRGRVRAGDKGGHVRLTRGRDRPARGRDLDFDLRQLAVQVVADVDRLLPLERLGVGDGRRAVAVHGVHGRGGGVTGRGDGHDVVVSVERDLEVLRELLCGQGWT
jgi:hypothetical protein